MSDGLKENRRLTVLVVEDEPAISLLQTKTLEESGYTVEQALIGGDAIDRLTQSGIDVVLLDHQLPGMSGEEILEKIKSISQPTPPVIMVTGHGNEILAARSIMLGARDYVVKDARLEYLKNLPDIIQRVHRQWIAEETARKLAEKLAESEKELRLAKEKAERYATLQDKFVSLVVHDLKSPLASMTGLLMILNSEWDNISHERRREIINRTVESGQQMTLVIEEIMNISKLRTGQIKPNPAFLDAYRVAEMAIESMGRWAMEKGVTLSNKINPGSRLYADLTLFTEALKNLVSNAIKFSREGGVVEVSYSLDQNVTSISVTDSGVGMDQDAISRSLSEDTRVSTPGTSGETGTGWGLKYCMDIMKAHDGSAHIESTPGKGSTVTLRAPTVKPVALIVDDEPLFLIALRKLAEGLGADVLEATDGEQAIKVIEERRPHIIISDIHMPNMNGLALLEHVRKNKDMGATPFVFLTSDTRIGLRDTVFRLGANDFINKPLTPEDFIPRVKRFII